MGRFNRSLDPILAEDIRREYRQAGGRTTYMELARRFRVSESTISRIVRGATYQNGGAPSTLATGSEDEIATLVKRMQETKRGVEAYGAVALAGVGGPPIVPSVSEATAKARAYWVMTRGEWPPEYTPTPDDLAYFGLDKPDSID